MRPWLQALYLDHLVLCVRDLAATLAFYRALLGEPAFQDEDSVMYAVGDTRLFFTIATPGIRGPYDKEQPGLNHLAFGVGDPALSCGTCWTT